MNKVRLLLAAAILIITAVPLSAQIDKPNEKFQRVWDGGTGWGKTISRAWEVEAGWDLDLDGKKEIAAFDADKTTLFIWESHGNGDNKYDLIWKRVMAGGSERSIFSGDLDNDGNPELIVIHEAETGDPGLKVFEWDGTDNGIPQIPTAMYDPPRNQNNSLELENTSRLLNMDSDPEPEFVLTYRGQNGLYLAILSLENQTFQNPSWKVEFQERSTEGAAFTDRIHGAGVGDINNDGAMDVLCSSEGEPGSFYVFTNTGEDTYKKVRRWAPTELPAIYSGCQSTILITDINQDGRNEGFIFGQDGFIYVIHDVTDLTTLFDADHFIDLVFLFEDANFRGGQVGDLDGDGYPDLYAAGNASNTIVDLEWLNSTGDNDVTNPDNYGYYVIYKDETDKLEYTTCAIGDLDGDGMNHGDLVASISPAVSTDAGIFLFEYDPVTEVNAIPITIPEVMPEDFALQQNYPNPFNPQTMIVYDLPKGSYVDLSIFNLQGQKVATLVQEHQGIGRYRVAWSGKDDQGQNVAAGVYLYCLTAGRTVLSKKMIFMP
ncbi:T9SS type A sorting domain-containing protein [bacterium]|nr:T9SS type A sorting domain-containing protein [bacterium]